MAFASDEDSTRGHAVANPWRAAARAAQLLGWTLGAATIFMAQNAVCGSARARRDLALRWTHRWAKGCARVMGLGVTVSGPQTPPGALLAPNHLGYLDILAIGSAIPCFFVPKSDVLRWPLIGWLVRMTGQPAVTRRRGRGLARTAGRVESLLAEGHSVCVFLEGTSTGGDRVLPFKPGLIEPALRLAAPMVPVGLRWSCDQPGVRVPNDVAYWTEAHSFGLHLWRVLGLRGLHVEIALGEPTKGAGLHRKSAAIGLRERCLALIDQMPKR